MSNPLLQFFGHFFQSVSPVANPGMRRQLYDDAGTNTLLSASALPASGAWRRSEIVEVTRLRRLALEISINYSASAGATAYPVIIPMVSSSVLPPIDQSVAPDKSSDVWFPPAITDGSVTGTANSGTLPTTTNFTNGPLFGEQVHRPLRIRPPTSSANSDKVRMVVALDVTHARWFQLIAAEVGNTAQPSTLDIAIVGSA